MSAETMAALAAMRPVIFTVWSLVAVPSIAALYCMGFLFKRPGMEKYYVIPKCTGSFLCVGSAALAIALGWGRSTGSDSHLLGMMLLAALALCMLGDFLIEYKLLAGGTAFGIAHIVLVLYALFQIPLTTPTVLLWVVGIVIMLLIFHKEIPQMGNYFVPFLAYVAILVGDLVTAAMLAFSDSAYTIYALGLLCFVASDTILGKRQFGHDHPALPKILMALYYMALYLMAASLWFTL